MRNGTLFAFAVVVLAVSYSVAAPGSETIDVQRGGGQSFTIIQDEQEVFWLAEVTPGNSHLVEPIPGLIADPISDSAAGSWRVSGQRLVYLVSGTKAIRPFDNLSLSRELLDAGHWFHRVGTRRHPDTLGSPLGNALGWKHITPDMGLIAAAGWLSQDRSFSALYAEQPDGHLQIWSWSVEQEQEDLVARPISEVKDLSERRPPGLDVLEWLTEMNHLDRGWRVIADEWMTLNPPLLLLDVTDGLFLIDDSGAAYSIQQDDVASVGTVPDWRDVDQRVLFREGEGVSLYGRRDGRWKVLNIEAEDGEVVLAAARTLDDELAIDFEKIVAAREDLKEEIATIRRQLAQDGKE